MGMTIDDHIKILKSYHNGFTGQAGNFQDAVDVAIKTMEKYQKIQEIVKDIPYGGEATVRKIQEVINGNDDCN